MLQPLCRLLLRNRSSHMIKGAAVGVALCGLLLSPCPVVAKQAATPVLPTPGNGVGGGPRPKRDLADFKKSNEDAPCYDRQHEPFTAIVDAHFHPRPFGGAAIPSQEVFQYFDESGVRFVTYMGLGQVLELNSGCTYYLDCPGVAALPGIKNDFVNGMDVATFAHDNVEVVLSMTFMDLANPANIVERIKLYDEEFPGMFKWAGEVNVIKAALAENGHTYATRENIKDWAPFMQELRKRQIPITLHSDLGNDAAPTQYLPIMQFVLDTYPDNKIVWAHMGLSKELTRMDAERHVSIMRAALEKYPNLYLDISWDVLFESYRDFGPVFVDFFNEYSERILPGTDFVAAAHKNYNTYSNELDITSRVNKYLSDEAFRNIALGENYFKLLGMDYQAPDICSPDAR